MSTTHTDIDYVGFANPFQGTDSCREFSNGNTNPLVARPWGMTHWALQTRDEKSHGSWMFQYGDRKCQGIRATHQPSPWITDYGHFTVMPVVGEVRPEPHFRSSSFRYNDVTLRPDYMSLYLRRYATKLEMTATERCSHFRVTYPKGADARLMVQGVFGPSEVKLHDDNRGMDIAVRGWDDEGLSRAQMPDDFRCYASVRVDRDISDANLLDYRERRDKREGSGDAVGLELLLSGEGGEVTFTVATSFISFEQATLNATQEIDGKSFDDTREASRQAWNATLGRIHIDGAQREQQRTFYTCLYRAVLFPRMFHEVNADGNLYHYSPYSGKVEPGAMSADNGFWDTFRTVYPLLALVYPDQLGVILDGWVNAAKEGGHFPKWASPGYRACMIGTHIDAVMADGIVKGIDGFDKEAAYEYMLKNGNETGPAHRYWGRLGLEHMREKGYVPCDLIEHGTARTLEFAYNDFCVAQVARVMGDDATAKQFDEHAQSFRNVFDPDVGLMRGRLDNGEWRPDFNPLAWSGPFCEGASIQYSYMVPHDVPGLIDLMGGNETFVQGIETMLTMAPTFDVGSYVGEVHEMSEMAAVDFGQYAHCNQPSHHILYLLALAGRPDLTNHWVRKALDELYTAEPDGLPGDEDNGEMTSWYVLAAMGLFSVCPGTDEYVVSCPRYTSISINVPGCEPLTISSDGPVADKATVSGTTLNGQPVDGVTLTHAQIRQGGTLHHTIS